MSGKYAVFMDYELDGKRNTVVLGGSINDRREDSCGFLAMMAYANWEEFETFSMWEVDEDDLPWGYKFQTYYVAAYTDDQLMIGVS